MSYTDLLKQRNAVWTMIGGNQGYDPGVAAYFGEGGLNLTPAVGPYDNDSLNKKLAAAKEWLKSRGIRC